ncbi:MAG TPA: hypothetical protein VFG68_01115 [Fimbriiglobus sp.]|nr:hypothetical protein [Fimbriiglobus sp.]
MRVPFVRLALAALATAWLASPARGQTTLTSGNATFTLNAVPTNENSATYSNVTFRPEGGTTTNHLYSQWLFYRVAGDTRERPLGTYTRSDGGTVSLSGSASADTMTYAIAESAASVTRFTGNWTLQLQDGTVPGAATVLHTVTITNPLSATSDLTLSLYHYLDFDLTGNFSNSASGDLSGMTITGGGRPGRTGR